MAVSCKGNESSSVSFWLDPWVVGSDLTQFRNPSYSSVYSRTFGHFSNFNFISGFKVFRVNELSSQAILWEFPCGVATVIDSVVITLTILKSKTSCNPQSTTSRCLLPLCFSRFFPFSHRRLIPSIFSVPIPFSTFNFHCEAKWKHGCMNIWENLEHRMRLNSKFNLQRVEAYGRPEGLQFHSSR